MIKFPKHCLVKIICNLETINLDAVVLRILVLWIAWNLLHPALTLQVFPLLQRVLLMVMTIHSWHLEALLLPLLCSTLQRQGSYQLNGQTPESKLIYSIFLQIREPGSTGWWLCVGPHIDQPWLKNFLIPSLQCCGLRSLKRCIDLIAQFLWEIDQTVIVLVWCVFSLFPCP